jgi:hypothetical protein
MSVISQIETPMGATGYPMVSQHRVWYEHEEFSWGAVHGVDIWRYEESELGNGEEFDFLENGARYSIEPPLWNGDESSVCRIENRLIEVTLFRVFDAARSG